MMKHNKFCSIRVKITIMVGLILLLTTLSLTAVSIINANKSFGTAYGYTELDGEIPDDAVSIPDNGEPFLEIQQQNPDDLQRNFAYTSIIYMILIASAGTLIIYLYIRRVTKPIRELDRIVCGINANNLNRKIAPFHTNDEVQSLEQSFNEMLDKLSHSFDLQKSFASNTAHELKTPLATMKASIQVLKLSDSPTSEEYENNISVMEPCIERLINTVEEIQCLSSDQGIVLNDEIPLSEAFEAIKQDMLPVADSKNISIEVEQTDAIIYGNKMLLTHAIHNLVENAVKYTYNNDTVTVFAYANDDETVIGVKDNGKSIPESECENIFKPYYRTSKAQASDVQGNGLGLSFVKSIVDKHNGSVTVTSKSEKGNVFEIHLPANH